MHLFQTTTIHLFNEIVTVLIVDRSHDKSALARHIAILPYSDNPLTT